jgi:ribonuclease HI
MELQYYLDLCTKTELAQAKRRARLGDGDLVKALQTLFVAIAQQQGIDLKQLLEKRVAEQRRQQQLQEARRLASSQRHQEKLAIRAVDPQRWNAWFDGSAHPNPGPCSIGVLLQAPNGTKWQLSQHVGHGSSSDAEYQALIAVLKLALEHKAESLVVRGDSRVIIDDVLAEAAQSSVLLSHWRQQAQALLQQLPQCELLWIPRARNAQADQLAAQARK